jgi:uncharacterized DUF497 family protein
MAKHTEASMDFRWNQWNIEHLDNHGVDPGEAEDVVRGAERPFPRRIGEDKWLVWGRGRGGRLLQIIFVVDHDGTLFVIHGRELTEREKRLRRRKRR